MVDSEIKIDWIPRKLSPGEKTKLTITLTIPDGLHIQAHQPAEDLLIPTKIIFNETEGIVLGQPIYPKPIKLPTSWSKVSLLVYEGKIDIFVPIEVTKDAKTGKRIIEGNLSFQGCTAQFCLPPRQQSFSLVLEVL